MTASIPFSALSDSGYEAARGHVFNHRNLYKPAAFIFVSSVDQVQNAVKCAVQLKVGIAPRSGGHSYEDYSLGGRDGVMVVDLGGLNETTLNKATGLATVGAGVRLGPMKLALWKQGKRTIPSGTCLTVGVGGHSLGGGWGTTSRKFGLMSDSIVEAQVVTARGNVVTASAKSNPDLFFALKGAGANSFGIVTRFTFKTFDVSEKVISFSYDYNETQQVNVLKAFQKWGFNAPDDVSASLSEFSTGGNGMSGIYLGSKSKFADVMKPFLSSLPAPTKREELEADYISTVLQNGGYKATDPSSVLGLVNVTYPFVTFKSKSIFVKKNGMSDAGVRAYIEALRRGSGYSILDLYGPTSAINKVPSNVTAFVHRDALYSIQMFTSWEESSDASSSISWIENLWRTARRFSSPSAYQNYIDVQMPLSAYYGSNLSKLKTVKKKWDPSNVFRFQQSIPLS
ncbi:hypothetical protein AXG93_411s1060 [Marchantia polymorpha subsp. ruderalis]|uniref:FAD-binding PCMH-type domain-containing protein n=1 Tax=Marchantia polymorpha subsp. ruderalis TaxID=1480154 RepID=A0A176VFR3_MARPO|nr:hypothetical protein AXG93_411s1060 [Marchantia polymorpha subsp. ruderalis]